MHALVAPACVIVQDSRWPRDCPRRISVCIELFDAGHRQREFGGECPLKSIGSFLSLRPCANAVMPMCSEWERGRLK